MTARLAFAPQFAALLLLGLAVTPTASAQDAMQLDTAFRDSLLRRPAPEGYREGRRQDASEAQEHIKATRRHSKRRKKV